MLKRDIYFFGFNSNSDSLSNPGNLVIGGKAFGLFEMSKIGIEVPPGFVLSTKECKNYYIEKSLSSELESEIVESITRIEKSLNKKFFPVNDNKNYTPLLFSIRSGAPVSMPGMMDTILNVGLNDEVVEIFAKITNNETFAYDSYRRLIEMYSNVVLCFDPKNLEKAFHENIGNKYKKKKSELNAKELKELIEVYKAVLKQNGLIFPQDQKTQVISAITAVFKSWMNERAVKYRKIYNISHEMGTAVTIQSMVFGNFDENSGTGVLFTRDLNTGKKEIVGEFLNKAQGEDIVAGIRTPYKIGEMSQVMPTIYDKLILMAQRLEEYFKDVQDIEFTVESGKLWILQTRNAKRTFLASIKIANDLVREELISKDEAIMRIDPSGFNTIFHGTFDQKFKNKVKIGSGLPASNGCASGIVVLDSELAAKYTKEGNKVILVREETSPEDISGMHSSEGILTAFGGMTSHAAVIARGFGKPCVCGCEELHIDYEQRVIRINGYEIKEFEHISIDGTTGTIFLGNIPVNKGMQMSEDMQNIIDWSKERSKITVRINAENKEDLEHGIQFGGNGVGLARTEHMFFEKQRLFLLRKLIIQDATKSDKIDSSISELEKLHCEDFISLFKLTKEMPINIRLIDPPMHEFLPNSKHEIRKLAKQLGQDYDSLKEIIESISETNPMIGYRGVRLGIVFRKLCLMECRAIFNAYIKTLRDTKIKPNIEIMIPLVIKTEELIIIKAEILKVKAEIEEIEKEKINCKIGIMVETPSSCIIADELSKNCEYFSFGTNDLTQTTLAISRDDGHKFIDQYIKEGIFKKDPFVSIDDNVAKMMNLAISKIDKTNKNFYYSVCGEQAANPDTIAFCIDTGFKYISCSPYRIASSIVYGAQYSIKKNS